MSVKCKNGFHHPGQITGRWRARGGQRGDLALCANKMVNGLHGGCPGSRSEQVASENGQWNGAPVTEYYFDEEGRRLSRTIWHCSVACLSCVKGDLTPDEALRLFPFPMTAEEVLAARGRRVAERLKEINERAAQRAAAEEAAAEKAAKAAEKSAGTKALPTVVNSGAVAGVNSVEQADVHVDAGEVAEDVEN
jgi:hypothetical protein